VNYRRVLVVAKTDLKQLLQARDFWVPMVVLGAMFFVVTPLTLLTTLTSVDSNDTLSKVSQTLDLLPASAKSQLLGDTPAGQTGYALAVYLLAPMAVIVPLTISTAIGAATIVGEREKGTGEFLAHSPVGTKEIFVGKLLASIVPGYLTALGGFGLYSLVVNLTVGAEIGAWFFPTMQWWVLIIWTLPPFLAICLSLVLRLSARVSSTAAAQQASGLVSLPLIGIAYGQASGALFGGINTSITAGAVAWVVAIFALRHGMASVERTRLLGVA